VLYGLRVFRGGPARWAVVLSVVVGVPLGPCSPGLYGWLDPIVSRFTDLLLAFPGSSCLAVGLAAILGPALFTAVIAIGVAQIPGMIRVTKG